LKTFTAGLPPGVASRHGRVLRHSQFLRADDALNESHSYEELKAAADT